MTGQEPVLASGPGVPGPAEGRLLSAARAGDARAVAEIYDLHAGALYRLARSALGAAAAEGVVVDVLVDACTASAADGDEPAGRLRFELARRTYQRCTGGRPPGARVPTETIVALCLFGGCTCREVALIVGSTPVGLPVLLGRHLQEAAAS